MFPHTKQWARKNKTRKRARFAVTAASVQPMRNSLRLLQIMRARKSERDCVCVCLCVCYLFNVGILRRAHMGTIISLVGINSTAFIFSTKSRIIKLKLNVVYCLLSLLPLCVLYLLLSSSTMSLCRWEIWNAIYCRFWLSARIHKVNSEKRTWNRLFEVAWHLKCATIWAPSKWDTERLWHAHSIKNNQNFIYIDIDMRKYKWSNPTQNVRDDTINVIAATKTISTHASKKKIESKWTKTHIHIYIFMYEWKKKSSRVNQKRDTEDTVSRNGKLFLY